MNIKEQIAKIKAQGYDQIHAEARLCQDIIIQALAKSTLHGNSLISKIDLGVHKDLSIKQEEYCFDICFTETNASLLINSKEQMFTEKLRSLLKFGSFSTRYKDIFDLYYLSPLVDKKFLMLCFEKYIFNDTGMKENNLEDIIRRVTKIFENSSYRRKLETTETNWLNIESNEILEGILHFFNEEI